MSAPIVTSEKSIGLPLLTQAGHEQSAKWTSEAYPQGLYIPQLAALQAAKTPDAIAVADGEQILTYRELDARANKLAQYLQSLGVQTQVLVGICLHRSVAMIVGALAVLKTGGAYLPLDPDYPAARLSFLLNDAQVAVLLTSQDLASDLPIGGWRVVELDTGGNTPGAQPELKGFQPRLPETQPEDLAYVIYTSGSTGQPKGVEITHASLLNLVTWHHEAFTISSVDRATQLASPGFDAAVWELWPYLTAGATLYLPDENTRNHAEKLRDWLVDQSITITFVPTPIAERLIQLDWPSNTSLRLLLTGGDRLRYYPPKDLPFVLVNNYGPTETAVVATSTPVLPDYRPDELPPIGRPIANTEVYILGEDLRPVTVGTAGELYIGGAGVARGYRGRPELTAERFIPNPFNAEPGARLYKTGDMGRFLLDGQIAFLGRIDDQVKIRGYRIEPNEIVSVLNRHPMIQASLVLAREDAPGDKRLVAYVVPKPETEPTDKVFRDYLGLHIPDYMVPAVFVCLEGLPLNGSGKIDRSALPVPTEANTLRNEVYMAPRTAVEQRVAGILATLLRLERVGVTDNFFFLGGSSLLGAQLIARVRDAFGVELTLLALFDHPTVADLCAAIEGLLIAPGWIT